MMTLPLNKKQKQLVEKSMDLVPIMIRSMTRTAAYILPSYILRHLTSIKS